MEKEFKILSIDGGGIKGIFPAKFLAKIEEQIGKGKIHEHFDLICGTSTGGIIALALSLGIPAQKIFDLYNNNASVIFGNKKRGIRQFKHSKYDNSNLQNLIKKTFLKFSATGNDPKIGDAKTNLLIPIYNLLEGKTSVLKTPHSSDLYIDKNIPMYMAACATSAAPTFFDPYSNEYDYIDDNKESKHELFNNKIDGGVYANNPSMLGIIEAITRLKIKMENIKVLSIGTGEFSFAETNNPQKWGILYWININKRRILDVFMQSQSQIVHNSVQILFNHKKLDLYKRIDIKFDQNFYIGMDETKRELLDVLIQKASYVYQNEVNEVLNNFFN